MVVVRWPVIVWAWYHIAKVVVWVHHHNQPQLRRFFFHSHLSRAKPLVMIGVGVGHM